MRSTPRRAAAGALAIALATALSAAACSRDDTSTPDSTVTGTAAAASIAPSKQFDLPAPVKIVALIGDKSISKDPNILNDFNDAIRLAVADINAVGGLGGHPIEFSAIDTPPVGDAVANSFNLGIAQKPTVLLGPTSSTAALSLASLIERAGIPTMHNSTDSKLATNGPAGSQWLFGMRPPNDVAARRAGEYAANELGARKIGLMNINTAFGQQGAAGVKQGIGDAQIVSEKSFPFNATDLATEVTSMNGADAVIDWGTPNTLTLAVKTFAQQGLRDVPHIGAGSVGFSAFRKGVGNDALLNNVYGAVDCNPTDDSRPATRAWAARFQQKYGYTPSYSAAEMYDSVFILRQVIEKAESAAPAAIRDGLAGLSGYNGVCTAAYTNKNGFLINQTLIGRYENGAFKTVKSYQD